METIDNKKIINLVNKYETPLYIYSARKIIANYDKIYRAFSPRYANFKICYSVKANSNLAILNLLTHQGAGLDCSSMGEIYLAKKSRSDFIIYSGNYNSEDELKYAIKNRVDIINIDDMLILDKLKKINIPGTISFRINLQLDIKNAPFVLAGKDSKFGIREKDILMSYKTARDLGVKLFGIHAMCGSCVLDPFYFALVAEKLMKFVYLIKKNLDIVVDFLDIGGGFGIPYIEKEKELDIDLTAQRVVDAIKTYTRKYNLKTPMLIIEPGRYIIGNAGYLLGQVQVVKESYKKFVGTDISVNSILRIPLFKAQHKISVLKRSGNKDRRKEITTICGQICWGGDIIKKDVKMSQVGIGDIIIIHDVGAYGFCHANQFNTRPRPAEVIIASGRDYLIRERETLGEFDRLVKIPPIDIFQTKREP